MSRMIYVGLLSHNIDGLCRFYRDVFGFDELEGERTEIFRTLDCGNIQLCFHATEAYEILGLSEHTKRGGIVEMITFDANSQAEVGNLTKRALDRGARLVKGPFVTYYNHYQVVLFDPDGNVFRITMPNVPA